MLRICVLLFVHAGPLALQGSPFVPPLHAMLMIFFFIMPGVMSGLGNLLVPIQLCVPELLFPKVNNLGITRDLEHSDPCHGPFRLRGTQSGGPL